MSLLFRFSAVGALVLGLLACDVSAAPYDDYGFYLMDDVFSSKQTSSRPSASRVRRQVTTQPVSNCPPVTVAPTASRPSSSVVTKNPVVAVPTSAPAARPRDRMLVTREDANLMLGGKVIQQVPVGSVVDVVEVRGQWVGVQQKAGAELKGEAEKAFGWVKRDDLQLISTRN